MRMDVSGHDADCVREQVDRRDSVTATTWRTLHKTNGWIVASLLGGLGMALNRWDIPLMTVEAPHFTFGAMLVLVAFARYGLGPGLLAAVITLAGELSGPMGFHAAALIYVAEGVVAFLFYRRTGSLVLSVLLFWILGGWIFDLLFYQLGAGLAWPFTTLVFVKQLLNGLMNAVGAEAILLAVPLFHRLRRGDPGGEFTLQRFAFSRIALAVMLPGIVAGMMFTRVIYEVRLQEANAMSNKTAFEVGQAVDEYLRGIEHTLEFAARRIEAAGTLAGSVTGQELMRTARERPEMLKLGITGADGVVRSIVPEEGADGKSLVGLNVSRMPYFQRLVASPRTVYAPLLFASVRIKDADKPEPVMVIGEPLLDADGRFFGSLLTAIDPKAFVPNLFTAREDSLADVTLFDPSFQVIASTSEHHATGASLISDIGAVRAEPLESVLPGVAGRNNANFTFLPPADGTFASQLGMDRFYGQYRPVNRSGWGVLVYVPASVLYARILPASYLVVAFLVVTIGLLYLVVMRISRRISAPLEAVDRTATAVAEGTLSGSESLMELVVHPVTELRSTGVQLLRMREALAERAVATEAREAESKERFRATFEQAAVGIIHTEPDGKIIRANRTFSELIGIPPADLVDCRIEEWATPADADTERELRGKILRGEQATYSVEQSLTRPDSGTIWVQTTVSLTRDRDGVPKYFIQVVQDLSERKDLEMRLLQAQKMEAIGLLAGGVAHDFNNLLTPILGYSDLSLPKVIGDPELEESLNEIRSAALRAKDLVCQLLAFGRKQVLTMRAVDLTETIDEFVTMIRRLFRENISIESYVQPDLGDIRGDPAQIHQILMNLAVNAQDAMPTGGTLSIRAKRMELDEEGARGHDLEPGVYVCLTVEDTGHGMDADTLTQVFEPFFTTKELGKGTGLGLSTVYGIVKQHKGSVSGSSQCGKGTTFDVILPGCAPQRPALAKLGNGNGGGGSERVMVVEDEVAVRQLVAAALRTHGYEVYEAGSGEEVLDWVEEGGRTDLLLSDVILPGIDGREMCARLAEVHSDFKVLFMSGYSDTVLTEDGVLDGDTHLLPKPFSIDVLTRRVREVLDA